MLLACATSDCPGLFITDIDFYEVDLRDDQQFFIDHPGAVPISTVQVKFSFKWFSISNFPLLVVLV